MWIENVRIHHSDMKITAWSSTILKPYSLLSLHAVYLVIDFTIKETFIEFICKFHFIFDPNHFFTEGSATACQTLNIYSPYLYL